MKDRIVQYPNRYRLTQISGDIYDLVPQQGIVTEEGTALNRANLLKDETALKMNLSGNNATVDKMFSAISDKTNKLLGFRGMPSYLAFVTNTNAESIDAALGKNNEDRVGGIGLALAMYAKYKNPTTNINSVFPSLIQCDTLNDISVGSSVINQQALDEINGNEFTIDLVSNSEYASNHFGTLLHSGGDNIIQSAYDGGTVTVAKSGRYKIVVDLYFPNINKTYNVALNGTNLISGTAREGGLITLEKTAFLNNGDVVSVTGPSNYIITLRVNTPTKTASELPFVAGQNVIEEIYQKRGGSYNGTVYTFNKAGTVRMLTIFGAYPQTDTIRVVHPDGTYVELAGYTYANNNRYTVKDVTVSSGSRITVKASSTSSWTTYIKLFIALQSTPQKV